MTQLFFLLESKIDSLLWILMYYHLHRPLKTFSFSPQWDSPQPKPSKAMLTLWPRQCKCCSVISCDWSVELSSLTVKSWMFRSHAGRWRMLLSLKTLEMKWNWLTWHTVGVGRKITGTWSNHPKDGSLYLLAYDYKATHLQFEIYCILIRWNT